MKFPKEIPMLCPTCNRTIPIPNSLGKRLYYKRKALNLTRREVCDELFKKGIPLSQATIGNIEKELVDIRLQLLKELAILYNTDLDFFISTITKDMNNAK